MNHISKLTALILIINCVIAVNNINAQTSLKITFVNNEGFLITSGPKKVLFDAPFASTMVPTSASTIQKMENASPPFDNVDIICVSHIHDDHFSVNRIGKHLENDSKTILICPNAAGNAMKGYANYNLIKDRIKPESVTPDSIIKKVVNGIPVTVCGFRESPPWNTDHESFLLNIDGIRIFHGGDSDGAFADELETIKLQEDSIDIAFLIIDYFWTGANNDPLKGLQKVKNYIAPKNIVIMHNEPSYLNGGQQIIDAVKNDFPNIYLFKNELEEKVLVGGILTGVHNERGSGHIKKFELNQNYPNPFNPLTTIKYDIPKTGHVSLDVCNILGQQVATLVNELQTAGSYSVRWDSRTRNIISTGVYFLRIRAGEYVKTIKMLMLK